MTISGAYGLALGQTKIGTAKSGMQIARQTGNLQFAGSEDLGGGMKAGFALQTAIGSIATTNGASAPATLGDRAANVSLAGGFGTFVLGRGNTSVRNLWGAIGDVSQSPVVSGLSASSSAASTAPVTIAAGDANARVIYGDTFTNYVTYVTPAMNGFSGSIALVPAQSTTTNIGDDAATKDTMSYTVQYASGPIAAGLNVVDAPATGGYQLTTALASYDLGVAKVGVTYQTVKLNAGGVKPGAGTAITVAAPIGAGIVSAGYGSRKATASTDTNFGDDVKQTHIGYRYNLSKRTNLNLISNKINRTGTATDVTETHLVVGHTF